MTDLMKELQNCADLAKKLRLTIELHSIGFEVRGYRFRGEGSDTRQSSRFVSFPMAKSRFLDS